MMNRDNLNIDAGDDSSNVQGQTVNIYNNGLSYRDVKEIATELFQNNFLVLKSEAAKIAEERATEIAEKVIKKLEETSPQSLNSFSQPGMQSSLFDAQKEYAISGDAKMGDMLVEILIERAKVSERGKLQILLDESIHVASKLTEDQMNLLTLLFLTFKVQDIGSTNLEQLFGKIRAEYVPLISSLDIKSSDLDFLEYYRLIKQVDATLKPVYELILLKNPAFFMKGFEVNQVEAIYGDINKLTDQLIPCLHNPSKHQFRTRDKQALLETLRDRGLSDDTTLFDNYLMSAEEAKQIIIEQIPDLEKLIGLEKSIGLEHALITQLGQVIAISNFKRITGNTLPFSTWIDR